MALADLDLLGVGAGRPAGRAVQLEAGHAVGRTAGRRTDHAVLRRRAERGEFIDAIGIGDEERRVDQALFGHPPTRGGALDIGQAARDVDPPGIVDGEACDDLDVRDVEQPPLCAVAIQRAQRRAGGIDDHETFGGGNEEITKHVARHIQRACLLVRPAAVELSARRGVDGREERAVQSDAHRLGVAIRSAQQGGGRRLVVQCDPAAGDGDVGRRRRRSDRVAQQWLAAGRDDTLRRDQRERGRFTARAVRGAAGGNGEVGDPRALRRVDRECSSEDGRSGTVVIVRVTRCVGRLARAGREADDRNEAETNPPHSSNLPSSCARRTLAAQADRERVREALKQRADPIAARTRGLSTHRGTPKLVSIPRPQPARIRARAPRMRELGARGAPSGSTSHRQL